MKTKTKWTLCGIFIVVGVVAAVASTGYGAAKCGRAAAQLDLLRGKYVVKSYGPGGDSRDLYAKMLKERGIELRISNHYCFTPWGAESVEEYNAVMYMEIEKRYGANFLLMLSFEAKRKYEDEHPKKK